MIARFIGGVGAALLVAASSTVFGQDFPTKPIRMLTGGVGGGADIAARIIAGAMTQSLSNSTIVENRGSGYGPGLALMRGSPDGYTVMYTTGIFWIMPLIEKGAPYDALGDFSPVTMALTYPNVLLVHPSLPVKTVKDLIELAKAKPGALNYGSTATGGSAHIAGEMLKSMAGIDIVRVNYNGGGPALTDLLGGRIQIYFATSLSADSYLKSGKLKALGVTSEKPFVLLPNLPTLAATGLPGYQVDSVTGIFAPQKTPAAIVDKLNRAIVGVLHNPALREKFQATGADTVGDTPQEFSAALKAEVARLSKLVKDANITAD